MNKSQNKIAKEIGISKGYLSDILKGKKGCNKYLMDEIKIYYPQLEFYIFTQPRYKVKQKIK